MLINEGIQVIKYRVIMRSVINVVLTVNRTLLHVN